MEKLFTRKNGENDGWLNERRKRGDINKEIGECLVIIEKEHRRAPGSSIVSKYEEGTTAALIFI